MMGVFVRRGDRHTQENACEDRGRGWVMQLQFEESGITGSHQEQERILR